MLSFKLTLMLQLLGLWFNSCHVYLFFLCLLVPDLIHLSIRFHNDTDGEYSVDKYAPAFRAFSVIPLPHQFLFKHSLSPEHQLHLISLSLTYSRGNLSEQLIYKPAYVWVVGVKLVHRGNPCVTEGRYKFCTDRTRDQYQTQDSGFVRHLDYLLGHGSAPI